MRKKIDLSDIPELSKAQFKKMRRVGRPIEGSAAKQMIALRLDPQLLDQLKIEAEEHGIGYQSLIQKILSKHFGKKSA